MPVVLVLIAQFCRDQIGPWNVEVVEKTEIFKQMPPLLGPTALLQYFCIKIIQPKSQGIMQRLHFQHFLKNKKNLPRN